MKLRFAIRVGRCFPAGCSSLVGYRQYHQLSTSDSRGVATRQDLRLVSFLPLCATLCPASGPSVDAADPSRMLPAYDSGDHLHPNDSGYEAMANEVDLDAIV